MYRSPRTSSRARRRGGLPAVTVVENLFEVGGAERTGKVESLGERAIQHAQGPQLLGGLDALGDDVDAQASRHGENAGDDRGVVISGIQAGYECTVDLQHVDREAL